VHCKTSSSRRRGGERKHFYFLARKQLNWRVILYMELVPFSMEVEEKEEARERGLGG
jgi:hypothetical protein